jgi:murein DD-endopeptidase MepM/ murein hydrolase activator NlpD
MQRATKPGRILRLKSDKIRGVRRKNTPPHFSLRSLACWTAVCVLLLLTGCAEFARAGVNGAARLPASTAAPTAPHTPLATRHSPPATHPAPPALPVPPATRTPSPLPVIDSPRSAVLAAAAAQAGAGFVWLNDDNTGVWQYAPGSFIHPLALEISDDVAYLLDGGRVLALDLREASPPRLLLAPGDDVAGVRVLEPLDLAVGQGALYVLDRAGDVYRYEIAAGAWALDRYDRPVEASSGHYFVALDAPDGLPTDDPEAHTRYLLETNYKFTMQYGGARTPLWNLPEARAVDISAYGADVYVLLREMHTPDGRLLHYRETRWLRNFGSRVPLERPRQVMATATAVYLLDQGGARLLALDPGSGALLRLYQPPQVDPISTFWSDPTGQRLILAGRERLYFVDQPAARANIPGGPTLAGPQLHDPAVLAGLVDFSVPIGGSNITFRDFQMPGAPRHYRLGIHEGVDFYWRPGTQTLAAADGVVMRATLDYVQPTAAQMAVWRARAHALGYTSEELLDAYRGRQVWIRHADGLVTRYAHLRSIAPGIAEGVTVARGQVIGEVGNSGSPGALESETADAHLHFELWLGEAYLGQFLRPIETREQVEWMLAPRAP